MELFKETLRIYNDFKKARLTIIQTFSEEEKKDSFRHPKIKSLEESYIKLIGDSFDKEREILIKDKIFFWGCNFNTYKNTYNKRLSTFFEEFEDAEEIDFIRSESKQLINPYFQEPFLGFIKTKTQINIGYSGTKKQNYLVEIASNLGYGLSFYGEDEDGYENFIIVPEKGVNDKSNYRQGLKWKGTQTELTALIKSLIESNVLDSSLTEKEILERFEKFFDFELKAYDQTKSKIRNRTKDYTPFLDRLKINLENWILAKDKN